MTDITYPHPFISDRYAPPNCNHCRGWINDTHQGQCLKQQEKQTPSWQQCADCRPPGSFAPSHSGSSRCHSGSIASGGTRAHCTCDVCF